jgi:proteasome accessory factor C
VSAADQLRRILNLIPAIADGEPHRISELTWDTGIDQKLLLDDLQSLTERFEVPGGFVDGLQIFVDTTTISMVPNHFLRPMRLTRSELCALELGLTILHHERPIDERSSVWSARFTLERVIAKLPDEEIATDLRYGSLAATGDLEHLRQLREAFRQRRRVRLRYRKAADEEATTRIICPYGIVFASGMWYAVAHCDKADEVRIFRLDRIESVEPLDVKFQPPKNDVIDSLIKEGKAFQSSTPGTLRVRYSPRIARWIAEREGKALDADGSLTMEHPLADVDWAVRHLLQYGTEVDVLEPEEIRVQLQQRLQRMEQLLR